ncbi:unnamed protein product, partial [Darwinula stevensoni]
MGEAVYLHHSYLNETEVDYFRQCLEISLRENGILRSDDHLADTQKVQAGAGKIPLWQKTRTVSLSGSVSVEVPIFVHKICSKLHEHLQTEGLFRKDGSKPRQKKLKEYMMEMEIEEWDLPDAVIPLGKKCQERVSPHDLVGLLKDFFKELPKSLIPPPHLACLLRTASLRNKSKTDEDVLDLILQVCLLLPPLHLDLLVYICKGLGLMQRGEEAGVSFCRVVHQVVVVTCRSLAEVADA